MAKVTVLPGLVQQFDVPNESDVTYNTTQVNKQALEIANLKTQLALHIDNYNELYARVDLLDVEALVYQEEGTGNRYNVFVHGYISSQNAVSLASYNRDGYDDVRVIMGQTELSAMGLEVGDEIVINGIARTIQGFDTFYSDVYVVFEGDWSNEFACYNSFAYKKKN